MLRLWFRFNKWLVSLGIAVIRKKPINWSQKLDELLAMANEMLDLAGYPKSPDPQNPTRTTKK